MTAGTSPSVSAAARRARFRARGLAPLELVLALPILLFLMALMVNYGTVASWKVRALTVARHSMWASRDQRESALANNPRPAYWPDNAGIGHGGAGDAASLADPRVDLPIARGPSIPIARGSMLPAIVVVVNRNLLDPTRGLHMGSAELERKFPLLASLGKYRLASRQRLFQNTWHYQNTETRGLIDYRDIVRVDALYQLPRADGVYGQRYIRAVVALLRSPSWRASWPLDRDPELLAADRRHPELRIRTDFYPRFSLGPTLDKNLVGGEVDHLIARIGGIPGEMEPIFKNLYDGKYD